MGGLTVWQSCDLEHTGFSQHSGSSQSVRPSAKTEACNVYHVSFMRFKSRIQSYISTVEGSFPECTRPGINLPLETTARQNFDSKGKK